MGNYSFKTSGLPEPVGGVIEGHNFTQGNPHTAIYTGQTGLTFRNCNLTNCDVPMDSDLGGRTSGPHISFCSHIHTDWVDKGYISGCLEACSHRTIVDTVTIDGQIVDTVSHYEDKEVI